MWYRKSTIRLNFESTKQKNKLPLKDEVFTEGLYYISSIEVIGI